MIDLMMGYGVGLKDKCPCGFCALKKLESDLKLKQFENGAKRMTDEIEKLQSEFNSKEQNTNGSAEKTKEDIKLEKCTTYLDNGKTLCDEFAMAALSGIISKKSIDEGNVDYIAGIAYEIASAMLRIRDMVKSTESSKG